MRVLHLHLDESLASQAAFCAEARRFDLTDVEARDLGPALRLWTRPPAFASLRTRLQDSMQAGGPWLSFAGSGDFHHVSLLLMARAAAQFGEPFTVVHFDNHPDWVRFGRGVHCGSWVMQAVELPAVRRVITIGVCSSDIEQPRNTQPEPLRDGRLEIYPWRRSGGQSTLELGGHSWPTIQSLGEQRFLELLLTRIPTQTVYVTIDKDALKPGDAVTNWDQGELSVESMTTMIRGIAGRHRIIGADVLGDWSVPVYAGRLDRWLKSAESYLDQPQRIPDDPASVNERVNAFLLRQFAGLMD